MGRMRGTVSSFSGLESKAGVRIWTSMYLDPSVSSVAYVHCSSETTFDHHCSLETVMGIINTTCLPRLRHHHSRPSNTFPSTAPLFTSSSFPFTPSKTSSPPYSPYTPDTDTQSPSKTHPAYSSRYPDTECPPISSRHPHPHSDTETS